MYNIVNNILYILLVILYKAGTKTYTKFLLHSLLECFLSHIYTQIFSICIFYANFFDIKELLSEHDKHFHYLACCIWSFQYLDKVNFPAKSRSGKTCNLYKIIFRAVSAWKTTSISEISSARKIKIRGNKEKTQRSTEIKPFIFKKCFCTRPDNTTRLRRAR